MVYPGFNDLDEKPSSQKKVFYRQSKNATLIKQAEGYIRDWDGLEDGAEFTPTDLLIVTWKNYIQREWKAHVCMM